MKRKFLAAALAVAFVASAASCSSQPGGTSNAVNSAAPSSSSTETSSNVSSNASSAAASIPETGLSGTLNIMSITDEMNCLATAFQKENPNVKVNYSKNGTEYPTKLQTILASGSGVPDVVALQVDYVKNFVNGPYLAELSVLKPFADEDKIYPFVLQAGTDSNGTLKALSFQATPAGVYYRRSIAKQYFGTDDPAQVQAMMSDFTKFKQMASTLKEKSGGTAVMISTVDDLVAPYLFTRSQPWIVNNTLTIDPKVTDLLNYCKDFWQNGYQANAAWWGATWFEGMNDTFTDASGKVIKVFCYPMGSWGVSVAIQPNAKTVTTDTSGDWAICEGPAFHSSGGTWMGIPKAAPDHDLALSFVKFATLDQQTLTDWAKGTYTNAYLKAINPAIGDISQPAGDFVPSQVVVQNISSSFDNSSVTKFLGGQNPYAFWNTLAPNIKFDLLQGTDGTLSNLLMGPIADYSAGKKSLDEAMKEFKDAAANALPDITVN